PPPRSNSPVTLLVKRRLKLPCSTLTTSNFRVPSLESPMTKSTPAAEPTVNDLSPPGLRKYSPTGWSPHIKRNSSPSGPGPTCRCCLGDGGVLLATAGLGAGFGAGAGVRGRSASLGGGGGAAISGSGAAACSTGGVTMIAGSGSSEGAALGAAAL